MTYHNGQGGSKSVDVEASDLQLWNTPAPTEVPTLAPTAARTWQVKSKSAAYCSYCTTCRFLENQGAHLGKPCNAGDAPVTREASIAGGGCNGHCGCNVHNRVDIRYVCV